jgi:hypothetical protein
MFGPLMSYRFSVMKILSGVAIIAVGVFLAVQVERRKAWPRVEADVVESEWSYSDDKMPEIRVVVRYESDGTSYEQPLYTDDWQTTGAIPKRYQAGSTIQIHCNPDDAEDAAITPGDHWLNVYAIGFGLFLITLGSLSPVHALLMWRARSQLAIAEREMNEFVANMEAARADLEAMTGKRGPVYKAAVAREQELIAQAEMLHAEYEALKEKLDVEDETE